MINSVVSDRVQIVGQSENNKEWTCHNWSKILQDATLQEFSKQRAVLSTLAGLHGFSYKILLRKSRDNSSLPCRKIVVIVFSKKLEAVRETETDRESSSCLL